MRLIYSIAACLGVSVSAPAYALNLPDCVSRPYESDSCSPVVACMPGDGVYLVGRAIGWNEGTLAGMTNTGVACTGTWRVGQTLRLGHARFSCDDGLSGQMIYYYQDNETGTARGTGFVSGFGRIRAWSGQNIVEFLDASGQRVEGDVMCGETPMLLSWHHAAASPSAKSR